MKTESKTTKELIVEGTTYVPKGSESTLAETKDTLEYVIVHKILLTESTEVIWMTEKSKKSILLAAMCKIKTMENKIDNDNYSFGDGNGTSTDNDYRYRYGYDLALALV